MTPKGAVIKRVVLLIAAAALPVAVAVALIPARDHIAPPTVALILVIVVVTAAAVTGNRLGALFAAVSAALGFDYFHTRPYGSFSIHRGEDVQTMILLLLTAGVVGELAAWGRRYRDAALTSTGDLSRLAAIGSNVADGIPPSTLVLMVAQELVEILSLRDCRFDPMPPPRPRARIDASGEVIHVGRRWPTDTNGLPGPEVELAVRWAGRTAGHFSLIPTPGVPVALHRRKTALVLAEYVGAALLADARIDD